MARRRPPPRRRAERRDPLRPCPCAPRPRTTSPRCGRSPNSPPPSSRRRSGAWKPPRRARPSCTAVDAAWPNAAARGTDRGAGDRAAVTYPVAVAVAAAAHGVPLAPALVAYLGAFAANIVSAGVRAIPIGQTDGQRIIAALAPTIEEIAALRRGATLDDLGGAALRADIASMKHETQYTRLFRS